ncbi:serine beta-lactamase-like protein LACTB, mitochondrial [Dermacentor andersoni]|uniref:serine beta-lactamase-like protein LACTB, mitochondrial n=1 Tax=Dermacentor andersoni TaxID=34620 RepID=UPI002155CD28|nr:serine beta-lactamase-like protein LACTB, mitochondrial [Dermacentor andersoni]
MTNALSFVRRSLTCRMLDVRLSMQRRLHGDARSSRFRIVRKASAICGGAICLGIGGYIAWTREPAYFQKVLASSPNTVESLSVSDYSKVSRRQAQLEKAINYAHELLTRKKDEWGVPGMVVAVSVDGKTVWTEGLGYADVENRVPCGSQTVMRIGSISKPIAMTTVAKLWEEGKIDLDKPIQDYVPSFPKKTFDGKPVVITLRDLVSHVAGIRHYATSKNSPPTKDASSRDSECPEFYSNKKFSTTEEALEIFKNDPLLFEPGTKYHYSTYGWTLISAAVENASKEPFASHLRRLLKTLGMKNTFLDQNEPIIYNRSRFYTRDKSGSLVNTPSVDCSYKWAGGGLLSTVNDLVCFGNAMLYCAQADGNKHKIGYLRPETVRMLWTPHAKVHNNWEKTFFQSYGMGWTLTETGENPGGCIEWPAFAAYHTGGSVGGTSALVLLPSAWNPEETNSTTGVNSPSPPRGVVVAVIGNISNAGYGNMAVGIAREFAQLCS